MTARTLALALVLLVAAAPPGAAAGQNDAGTGGDAGGSFADATPLAVPGLYRGELHRYGGDRHDWYRFPIAAGGSLVVRVDVGGASTEPIRLLDPHGRPVDVAQSVFGVGVRPRLELRVTDAPVGGDYRLHLQTETLGDSRYGYALCFLPCASAGEQDDAGTGGDAGNTRATATRVAPAGLYAGHLTGSGADDDDYYAFHVPQGGSVNVEIRAGLTTGFLVAGAPDNSRRLAFQLLAPDGTLLDTPNTNQGDARVTLARAPLAGDYLLRVTAEHGFSGAYAFCFLPRHDAEACAVHALRPIGVFADGSLRHTHVRVLLVPPTHGDLGNPTGPTVLDYLAATMRGIEAWEPAIARFAADHPQYAYLRQIEVEVEVFDGLRPLDPAGYDFVILYAETAGPLFRGLAGTTVNLQPTLDQHGLPAHFSGRYILLSLFSASPRAGQLEPDYPEVNDLEAVTMHEFAHAFGLGHTLTWTREHGADLMNSPATFVYGDGDPLGDGGERTPRPCISSLDLYGLAYVYRWIPGGTWQPTGVIPPSPLPYTLYCGA